MNLNEEVRDGYTISTEMKKVWAIQLDLVQQLIKVCEKYDLKVWGCGGTMLGAIRHKGYIPWDDDIDMCMMRKDYDKLLSIADKEFSYPYFFQTGYSDIKYPRGHAQLRNSNTTAILPGDIFADFNQGIFIDIFVYDNIPENKDDYDNLLMEADRLQSKLSKYSALKLHNLFISPTSFFVSLRLVPYFLCYNFKSVYKRFEDIIKDENIKRSTTVASLGFNRNPERLKRMSKDESLFTETVYVPFEDISMPLPKQYHILLTNQYGDYMKPSQSPSLHGGCLILDADKPYTYYLSDLRKQKIRELLIKYYKKLGAILKRCLKKI